jgi:hypothetical protein
MLEIDFDQSAQPRANSVLDVADEVSSACENIR